MVVKKWSRYFTHPLTVGFILSFLVIYLVARILPRYYTELEDESTLTNNGEVYYFDLNNDGNSEKLHYYHYGRIFQPTLYLYDSKDNFMSLWNFLESPVKTSVFAGDYNNDSIREIFIFTENSDSLFLYVLNSENDKENIINRAFIGKGNISGSRVHTIGLYNMNESDSKEFLFAIDGGYPKTPRRVCLFDIDKKNLVLSPELTANISNPIIVDDINSDQKPEVIVSNSSVDVVGNGSESSLIVLNNQLKYLFKPVVFHGGSSQITANVISSGGQKLIAVLNSGTSPKNVYNNLMLYNAKGEQIKEANLNYASNLKFVGISGNKSLYLFSGNKILKYSSSLKKERAYNVSKGSTAQFVDYIDVTGDSVKDLILRNKKDLIIVSDNFRFRFNLKIPPVGRILMFRASYSQGPDKLSVQVGKKWYLYNFYKNESFFYSIIFYFLVFIVIISLVFLVSKIKFGFLKRVFTFKDEDDFLIEVEDNIEEKFNGLRSKVKEVSSEFNSDSYTKIVNEIDETIKKVKTVSKNSSEKTSVGQFKSRFNKLIKEKHYSQDINIHIYPENGFNEVKPEILNAAIQFTSRFLDILNIKGGTNLIEIQIVLHDDYLNLIAEAEAIILEEAEIIKDKELEDILKPVKGKTEVDIFGNMGTIISTSIPLRFEDYGNSENKKRIKIIIAEDHEVSLFGLVSLFKTKDDFELVGTAKNGMEVLKMLASKDTDVVITDISMPGMDGIELSEQLKNNYPNIKVVVFTMYLENWFVEQLINNGAKGFVSKNSKMVELIGAVKSVYEGNNYYCPQFKSKFGFNGNNNRIVENLESLTKNEMQIVKHYADNYTKGEIAVQMKVNTKTIDTFVANILLKLNAGDEEEIIRIAKKQKFISE